MAGISTGSHPFFRISPAKVAETQTFALRRGNIEGRLDIHFNHPRYELLNSRLDAALVKTPKLENFLVSISSGATPKRSDTSLYADSGVKFFRILNIKDGEILERNLKYITNAVHTGLLDRSRLATDDVLMTITGRVGSAAIVQEDHLPANINQHIVRLRIDKDRCRPGFLVEWLNCPFGLETSNRSVSGGTRAALDYEAIRKIRVPLPNSLETQDSLLAAMNKARMERNAKLEKANALLTGLDDFVLNALGINPSTSQKAVFAVRAADSRDFRFDPDFHSLRFRTIWNQIEQGRYSAPSIAKLCTEIKTGFPAGRQNQAFNYESGIPHLRPLNLDAFGQLSLEGTKFVPKTSKANSNLCVPGEVLFNNTNSTELVGKSAVFDLEQPCVCSNHITRLKPRRGVISEYLAAVLNALRGIGYLGLLSTNFNNQAGINTTTLSQLRIPQPPEHEQEGIVTEIRYRRKESRRLRLEAESGWQDAKRWFEEQLLDSPSS